MQEGREVFEDYFAVCALVAPLDVFDFQIFRRDVERVRQLLDVGFVVSIEFRSELARKHVQYRHFLGGDADLWVQRLDDDVEVHHSAEFVDDRRLHTNHEVWIIRGLLVLGPGNSALAELARGHLVNLQYCPVVVRRQIIEDKVASLILLSHPAADAPAADHLVLLDVFDFRRTVEIKVVSAVDLDQ